MSDPGRALILLGPPYRISGRAGAPTVSSMGGAMTIPTDSAGGVFVPGSHAEQNRQVWTYAHERKPKYINQSDFVLVFLDEGKNEWQLAHTERTNPDVILMEALNGLIVSPHLTRAPFSIDTSPRATSFRDLLLDTAYKEFRAAGKPAIGPASLTWGEFVSPEGQHFASVQIYVPAGHDIAPGKKLTFFGVLENGEGKI